jgi:hypothetical protein
MAHPRCVGEPLWEPSGRVPQEFESLGGAQSMEDLVPPVGISTPAWSWSSMGEVLAGEFDAEGKISVFTDDSPPGHSGAQACRASPRHRPTAIPARARFFLWSLRIFCAGILRHENGVVTGNDGIFHAYVGPCLVFRNPVGDRSGAILPSLRLVRDLQKGNPLQNPVRLLGSLREEVL